MITNLKSDQRGFTLVEGLITIAVLGFGFLAVNKLQMNTIKAKNDSTERSQASTIATAKMEQLRNFDSVKNFTKLASGTDSKNGKNTNYDMTWNISDSVDQKNIDLIINWKTSRDQAMQVHLTSVIAKSDPKMSGEIFNKASLGLPAPTQTASRHPNVPSSAIDNKDGTSDYTPTNSTAVVTYDNTTGNIIKINHNSFFTLSGSVSVATGVNSPGSIKLNTVTLVSSDTSNGYCNYSSTDTLGTYTCYVSSQWKGSITLGGVSNVKVCTNTKQPYNNLTASLLSQDYTLVKKTRACFNPTPTQHQLL